MIIEESDFKLVQVGETSYLWDLYLLKTINPRDGIPREELTLDGYGLPLDAAIRRIASFRIAKKHSTLNMAEYLDKYRKIIDNLSIRCKSLSEDKAINESNV